LFCTGINKIKHTPGWDIIHNLQLPVPLNPKPPECVGIFIGGASCADGKDLTALSPDPFPELDYTMVAQVEMCYAVTRCDTNQHIWQVAMMPRLKKGNDASFSIQEMGIVINSSIKANGNIPMMCVGEDFLGSYILITRAFLGALPQRILDSAEFFNKVTYKPLTEIALCPYKVLHWNGFAIFNSGCGAHEQKSWVDTGTRQGHRFMKLFDFWVSTISAVSGGAPIPLAL